MTNNSSRKEPLRIGVLGSGKGSNLQSIIDAVEEDTLNARITCVLADVENAFILERAAKHNIAARFVSADPFKTKLDGDAEQQYVRILQDNEVEIVVLAGFMRMIKKGMLSAFSGRMLNIHPSLLPAFPGLEAWKQALDYRVKITGCTVHFVSEGMDTGPIIIQKAVPVLEDDTPETLHARIQSQEHVAYPEAIRLVAEGKVSLENGRLTIRN
jgi:phosphoribosylglycinamide formyltransferase-1